MLSRPWLPGSDAPLEASVTQETRAPLWLSLFYRPGNYRAGAASLLGGRCCSDLDTTETEASRWSRASPEVSRGRPRGADRWKAAWLAFPAGSGGTGSTGEWGRAVQGWNRLREVTRDPACAPAPEPAERRCFCLRSGIESHSGLEHPFSGPLGSQALDQYAFQASSVVSGSPRTLYSFLACVLSFFSRVSPGLQPGCRLFLPSIPQKFASLLVASPSLYSHSRKGVL